MLSKSSGITFKPQVIREKFDATNMKDCVLKTLLLAAIARKLVYCRLPGQLVEPTYYKGRLILSAGIYEPDNGYEVEYLETFECLWKDFVERKKNESNKNNKSPSE